MMKQTQCSLALQEKHSKEKEEEFLPRKARKDTKVALLQDMHCHKQAYGTMHASISIIAPKERQNVALGVNPWVYNTSNARSCPWHCQS